MADFDVQGKITFDSTQAQTALKQTASSADQAAASTAKVGEAAKTAQPQIGQFGSALGLAGQAVGQLVPGLGQVVTVAGSATGVIQSLTTAGLGPLGIAIGAVSTLVVAGVGLWKEYTKEQERSAQAIRDRVIPSLDDLISKQKQVNEQLSLRSRLTTGGGTFEEQAAFTQEAQLYAERAALRVAQARDDERLSGELNSRIAELERAQQVVRYRRTLEERATLRESAAAREQEQARSNARTLAAIQAEAEAAAAEGSLGGNRRAGGGARRAPSEAAPIGRTSAEYDNTDLNASLARLEQDMAAEADVRRMMREQDIAEQNAAKDRAIEIARERNDELTRLSEEQAARMQEINDAVFGALESAFASSVSAWLDGSKSMGEAALGMVRDVARALTTEAIVQGLKQTALGISALAVGSPTAAGHFAAAAKWAAVGVAAGVAGAATGAFGGGGGGGGAPAAATGGPALTPGASESAGTTVVINWGSSGLVYAADRAQLGRDIAGMIGEANSRLGRGM